MAIPTKWRCTLASVSLRAARPTGACCPARVCGEPSGRLVGNRFQRQFVGVDAVNAGDPPLSNAVLDLGGSCGGFWKPSGSCR